MSDEQLLAAEVEHLWVLAYRKGDGPWAHWGTHNADPAVILRTYDYRVENAPEFEYGIHKVTVITETADIDVLRKKVEEDSAAKKGAVVQSE